MGFEQQHFLDRFKILEDKLKDPSLFDEVSKYAIILKELSVLKPLVLIIKEIQKNEYDLSEYNQLLTGCDKSEEIDINDEIKLLDNSLVENTRKLKTIIEENTDGKKPSFDESEIKNQSKTTKIDFDKILKKIKTKDWKVLREEWLDYIPLMDSTINKEEEKISDLVGFEQLIKDLTFTNAEVLSQEKTTSIVFKGKINKRIRTLTIEKGLLLLHKASHIISAGELHAHQGLITWSLSSSYQGSLLAARSIMYLLGISIIEIKGRTYIVDSFANNNSGLSITESEVCIHIIEYPYRINHKQTWKLFIRILKSYNIGVWQKDVVKSIISQDASNFPKQRNTIHYWGNEWIFNDLHKYEIDNKFGIYNEIQTGLDHFELKSDFSMTLSIAILKMAITLVNDLSSLTNKLKNEKETFNQFLHDYDRHPIYVSNYQ